MEWLNKRLYTTKEEQDTWTSDNWFAVLSQIIKFFNDAMMILTEDRVKSEKDEKIRHSLEIMYRRKVYAENEIKSWDLNKMTYTIKAIMKAKGFKTTDIQDRCGFNTPQAIFKWFRGDAVPTIDNMIIIADMFGVTIDQIVIIKRI